MLRYRKQRVILKIAGAPQGSILGPLLFLTYINDLSDNFPCNPKLFADDTSLFSTVKMPKRTTNNPSKNLKEIKNGLSSEKEASTLTKQSRIKRLF